MRAPLLSATSSLDRSCTIRSIIYCKILSKLLLDDLHQTPALQLALWPRLHDPNHVASFRLILLVVRVKLFHLFNDFAELGVGHARDRPYYNRLVHAAGNHFAGARLARATGDGYGQRGRLRKESRVPIISGLLMLLGHNVYAFSVSF